MISMFFNQITDLYFVMAIFLLLVFMTPAVRHVTLMPQ